MPYILRSCPLIQPRAERRVGGLDARAMSNLTTSSRTTSVDIAPRTRRQRLEFELTGAGLIQQHLLPAHLPPTPGFEIAAKCIPAETVGGDYYDVIFLADGAPAVVVGDVSGHGLGPALLMAETRGMLRGLANSEVDPGAILHKANRLLLNDCDKGAFVTLFIARLDRHGRTIRYACAGHEAMLIRGLSGEVQQLTGAAPPIGVVAGFEYVSHGEVTVAPGDALLCCTDGITEGYSSTGDRYFGREGVLAALAGARSGPAETMLDGIFAQATEFQDNQHDDMTAMVVRTVDC